jgi:phosphate-selective porin OprO/OprP
VEASYTFGGSRSYKAADGVYSGVKPAVYFSPAKGGMGAVEIAARVSQMDLTDRYNPNLTAGAQPGFVNGGRQTNYTVALNWYWNPYMLWKVNYIHTNIDKVNPTATAGGPGILAGLKADQIGVRWQVMY